MPDKKRNPPEFAWWEFNFDDVADGKGASMSAILDATNPHLSDFSSGAAASCSSITGGATRRAGEPTLDYYKAVVADTFGGDVTAAREKVRLFMVPGMGHCSGGPGCDKWDRLAPLVEWVENGKAPDYLVAEHLTGGDVDNQRQVCAYPQRAVYIGPAAGQNDAANWVETNFVCR